LGNFKFNANMKKIITLCLSLVITYSSFSQGSKQSLMSFPQEWLMYEYYEHQLFFAHNSLDFFKSEVASSSSECSVKTYNPKTKQSSWQVIKGMSSDGFTYSVQEKKGIVEKTILFQNITDWKFSKNGVEYGHFSKSQLISFNTLDENYNLLLNNIMKDFYQWRFNLDTRNYNMAFEGASKPSFEFAYDIMNFEDKDYQIQFSKDVERTPQFPGGIYWMHKYINSKIDLKKYENLDLEPIFVRFNVAEDGSIKNIAIVRGEINLDMDEMVAKMVYDMPRWIPGYRDGKTVETTVFLPVYFNY
jgi:hypothetical protein